MNLPIHLTQALILALLLSGCAHQPLGPKIDTPSAIDTHELMTRLGYPKCRVSVPLTEEDAVKSAALVGAPDIDKREDWAALIGRMTPGDELRHVWCSPYRGPGGIDLIGVFRDKHLIAKLHTVFVD